MKDLETQLSQLSAIEKIDVPDFIFDKIQSKITEKTIPDNTIWFYGITASILVLFSFSFVATDAFKDKNRQNTTLNMDSSSVNFLNY